MSLWTWLFGKDEDGHSSEETDTVRKIVTQLESMPRADAQKLGAFAYVLGRVAYADRHISDDETAMMEHLVQQYGDLSTAQAVLVVEIAKQQAELFGGTENFPVTKAFADMASPEDKEHLLHCAFAVAAADDSISNVEDRQVRQIASELKLNHRDFVTIRSAYNDKREVVKMGAKS